MDLCGRENEEDLPGVGEEETITRIYRKEKTVLNKEKFFLSISVSKCLVLVVFS